MELDGASGPQRRGATRVGARTADREGKGEGRGYYLSIVDQVRDQPGSGGKGKIMATMPPFAPGVAAGSKDQGGGVSA